MQNVVGQQAPTMDSNMAGSTTVRFSHFFILSFFLA